MEPNLNLSNMNENTKIINIINKNIIMDNNFALIIVPSWGKLLGLPEVGSYISSNQKISKMKSDPIIFFQCAEATILLYDEIGIKRRFHYIFGVGSIFLNFEIKNGRFVADKRHINGILLEDFVYDYLASGPKVTLENDRDVIISDFVNKIPFDYSFKTDTQKSFISGAIMRNVFIPQKDKILELMDEIKMKKAIWDPIKGGLILIAATEKYFNKIILETNNIVSGDYLKKTAEISGFLSGINEVINDIFSDDELSRIKSSISKFSDVLAGLDFDPMNLQSILDNCKNKLNYHAKPIKGIGTYHPQTGHNKENILLSSAAYLDEIKKWNEAFKRNNDWVYYGLSEEDLNSEPKITEGIKNLVKITSGDNYPTDSSSTSATSTTSFEYEPEEKYELDINKRHKATEQELPPLPEIDPNNKDRKTIITILKYLRGVAEKDYSLKKVGIAAENTRELLRKIMLQSNYMWEISKIALKYSKESDELTLNKKERKLLLEKIDSWINQIIEEERKEREERERLEREERERLEREERERKEREERERREREERERREREERERLEREERERKESMLQTTQIEAEIESADIENESIEEDLMDIKEKQKRLKQELKERKRREKEEKKKRKKLEKEKKKLEKLKKKLENN
ncbi:MAG: hypothetical protein ACTSU2_10620 [Promethearchaeota archaeon]